MTAIGLFVAVPAVLLYNLLVRRNKVINEKLRSFASEVSQSRDVGPSSRRLGIIQFAQN